MGKKIIAMIIGISIFNCIAIDQNIQQRIKKKLRSFFSFHKAEKINQQELPAASINSLSLRGIDGSVTIKTGSTKSLCIKTIIRARKQEDVDATTIAIDMIKNNHLAIATKCKNKKAVAMVDYELIVPETINLSMKLLGKGSIVIKDVKGSINVVAQDSIAISNTKKSVIAKTYNKGPISIINAFGPVDVVSCNGIIKGEKIAHSFRARSKKGKITIAYIGLPPEGTVDLKTESGAITLGLPSDTNAEIKATTFRGTLTSDLYVTLHPYTTQLNTSAWNKFKREVDGILGFGQATINLQSTKGNIVITNNNAITHH